MIISKHFAQNVIWGKVIYLFRRLHQHEKLYHNPQDIPVFHRERHKSSQVLGIRCPSLKFHPNSGHPVRQCRTSVLSVVQARNRRIQRDFLWKITFKYQKQEAHPAEFLRQVLTHLRTHRKASPDRLSGDALCVKGNYFTASATATATATVAPTMGLLPMPRKPIISTCAGTELEPANCASLCIRPMVSVMP